MEVLNFRPFAAAVIVIAGGWCSAADVFDRTIANISILQDKNVQKEVGILQSQKDKMNVFAGKFSDENKKKIEEYNKAKKQPDAAFQTFMNSQMTRLRTQVLGVMNDAQIKRLRELTLQAVGPRAVIYKNVALKIGLTVDQHSKVLAAYAKADRDVAQIKRQIAVEIEKKFGKNPKPKSEAEGKGLKLKVDKAINELMEKRKAEFSKIGTSLNTSVAAIVSAKYQKNLFTLMGKAFKPAVSAKPKK